MITSAAETAPCSDPCGFDGLAERWDPSRARRSIVSDATGSEAISHSVSVSVESAQGNRPLFTLPICPLSTPASAGGILTFC